MMYTTNGIKIIDLDSEQVLQSTEYHFDNYFYREAENFGTIRYGVFNGVIYCDGYVPWVGF